MNVLGRIGAATRQKWGGSLHIVAVASTALVMAFQPRRWPQPVRNVLARQILFTGFEAWRFMSLIALLVGIAVVVQAQVLLKSLGQTAHLGSILVMVIVREVGPILTNFVVLGRSGNAMATEMANMKLNGEVHALEAQGVDPFLYLVLPRVIGAGVSTFCLTVIFIVSSFVSGYLSGALLGANAGDPEFFMKSVFGALTPADVFNFVAKSIIPGMLMGATCCIEGLSVGQSITEVPQATSRAVVRSTAALFLTSALVSVVTYV